MSDELGKLLKQKEEIEEKINLKRKEDKEVAVEKVKEIIRQYEMTITDLRGAIKVKRKKKAKSNTVKKSARVT